MLQVYAASDSLCSDSIINSEVEVHLQSQKSPWKEILIHLRDWYGNLIYHTWFTKVIFIDYNKENNLLNIRADTTFYGNWIDSNYKQDILKASQLIIPQIRDIEIHQ
ncbi:DnaA N-terminal domain-containing protein [Candidatus Tisiphia endosymbiont of Hybos culiciformis]|uniref:DnaA N-terminal domain-containing protein n=1 Tax=Candidatus Tisiphia endosymbiont of Hybos culiciformis TaxID=3139331 RepID=UPI003CCB1343